MMKTKTKLKLKNNWKTKTKTKTKITLRYTEPFGGHTKICRDSRDARTILAACACAELCLEASIPVDTS